MNIKFERDPLDYLKHIERSLREAPHKQVNGGVLVAEILVDSIDGWCEFLREVIATAEKSRHEGSPTTHAADGAKASEPSNAFEWLRQQGRRSPKWKGTRRR